MFRLLQSLVRVVTRAVEAGDNALADIGNPPPKTSEPATATRRAA